MTKRISKFFKDSKDKRIKFNFHMGSFLILNVVIVSIIYIYAKIFSKVFDIESIFNLVFSYYIFLISIPISAVFSIKSYYWYYQRDLLDNLFTNDDVESLELSQGEKIDFLLLLIYKIFPYFLISSFLIITILNKQILDEIDVLIVLVANVIFICFLIKNLTKKFNYFVFKKIKYDGIMTNYSKENEYEKLQ